MKIRVISDTHNENVPAACHHEHLDFILPHLDTDSETVLVLAGDVWSYAKPKSYINFLDYVKDDFKAVVIVAGNHEWYGSIYPDANHDFLKYIEGMGNIHFLNGTKISIDGVSFVGTTLWTDFHKNDPLAKLEAESCMMDYQTIKINNYGVNGISAEDIYKIHLTEFERLTKLMQDATNPTVVVTHHGPSYQSIHPKYNTAGLSNYAFSSNLDEFIKLHHPKLWIHGHTHTSFDYQLFDTRVVVNPVGYKHGFKLQYENRDFNKNLVLEI